MADPAGTALAEPGARGSLHLHDRVIERIAAAAATRVRGVAPTAASGRGLPDASCELAGHRARVSVEIAAVWPAPVPQVAMDVRDAVTERLEALAGVQADVVHVTVARVVRSAPTKEARVR